MKFQSALDSTLHQLMYVQHMVLVSHMIHVYVHMDGKVITAVLCTVMK